MIRNFIMLIALCVVIYIIYMYNPFTNHSTEQQINHETSNAQTYNLEDNQLFKNIPASQIKNVFNFMDKQEFMSVSGLTRMGYNQDYLIGQRGNDFIFYHFGDQQVLVFKTEQDLNAYMNTKGVQIQLKDQNAY
ncbi:DUF4930 family protein [Macrococcus sp. DPC7161]|nr:DUF4930 family protein [Macrococcus sp. DPC7161]